MALAGSVIERTATPGLAVDRYAVDRNAHPHSVQFYESDAALLDELERYVGDALAEGDSAVVVATPEHRSALAERLRSRVLDVAGAARQGRYLALDASETLAAIVRNGWPDAARFFDLIGGVLARARAAAGSKQRHVAVYGELVALLAGQGNDEAAIRLEELWNELQRTHAFSLHCGYPMSTFDRELYQGILERICASHSRVTPAESFTSLVGADQRGSAIVRLQQKARALEAEIQARKRVERMLHQQEEALRERNRELSAALAARDEFLSVAAHELKTPVTSLRIFAQLLLRDARRGQWSAPERVERALKAIESQTGKMGQLVERLLDTTQIEAGRLRIDPVPIDLVPFVGAIVARQELSADHALIFEAPEHLEAVVDPIRFEQVVTNLLDNAVKFSPNGGPVTVELGRTEDGGVRLSVTDRGVGIPPDQRAAVFDRLHQAHGERHLSGLGLGLYVTREIVESHGGCVRIEESAQPGTRFVVELPPAAADAQSQSVA